MQTQEFVNLDWTNHNKAVIQYCILEARKAVAIHTADYPPTKHLPVIKGILLWDRLDYFLEAAANNELFEGITAKWITYEGAPILELRGKYTKLTACHVSHRDEDPKESKYGYRKNNRAKNEKNLELFKEFEASVSEDEKLNLILQHGEGDDNFAYLRMYLEASDIPVLSENIMLMEAIEMTPETEFVPEFKPVLKSPPVVSEPEILPALSVEKNENDHSQS
jgi:hypothetical protein